MPKKSNFLTLQSVLLAIVFVRLQTPQATLVATPRRELDATTTTGTDACAGIEAAAARWAGAMPLPSPVGGRAGAGVVGLGPGNARPAAPAAETRTCGAATIGGGLAGAGRPK